MIDTKHFVGQLPTNLGIEISYTVHKDIVYHINFLQDKPKAFIATLGPLLKPLHVNKDEIIFSEGDSADESNLFFQKFTQSVFYQKW